MRPVAEKALLGDLSVALADESELVVVDLRKRMMMMRKKRRR